MDCAGQSLTRLSARRELIPVPGTSLGTRVGALWTPVGSGQDAKGMSERGKTLCVPAAVKAVVLVRQNGARGAALSPSPCSAARDAPGDHPLPEALCWAPAGWGPRGVGLCPRWHQPRWPHAAGSSASPRTPHPTAPPPLHTRFLWVFFRGSCPIGSSCLCLCFISGCL